MLNKSRSLRKDPKVLSYLALAVGILCLSLSPLFVRWADAPGVVTSFYRMFIVSIILTIVVFTRRDKHNKSPVISLSRKPFILFLPVLCGIFTALDHTFWSTAVETTNVANGTLLNYIALVWVALFAIFVFGEKYRAFFWLGLVMVFGGAAAVIGIENLDFNNLSFSGEGLAIISSFFYAGYFLSSQKARQSYEALELLWLTMIFAAGMLAIIVAIRGFNFVGYSQKTYITFLLAALIPQLCGYYAMVYALGRIPASIVTPTMVLQPVTTAFLAIPFLGETLSAGQLVGGFLVISGVYLVNRAKINEPPQHS